MKSRARKGRHQSGPKIIPNLSEEPFVVIPDNNSESLIKSFCNAVLLVAGNSQSEESDTAARGVGPGGSDLFAILMALPKPYTIVQETYHIDKSFRDTYYMYFSNQHFHTDRHSRRLSFIRGRIGFKQFFSMDAKIQEQIQRDFMGSCVINPLVSGAIGRTLISPRWLLNKDDLPAYVRLSEFKVHILGKEFSVRAFPFRAQDEETMRCTEVTLLNLLEFYSNSYDDYRAVVPKDIIESEQRHSHERVLPSRGITYPILTKVLSDFGFSPRLYNLSAVETFNMSGTTQDDELKRWLHYYIESGIPVALNLLPINGNACGHSMVCVGHGHYNAKLIEKAYRQKRVLWSNRNDCHPIVNSADFYEDYVVVDDNQPVYQIRNFKQLSIYPDMRVVNIAAPLYKRMFLDAPDAASIIMTLLQEKEYGIDEWSKGYLEKNEDVIVRLFMASSKSFKAFRKCTLNNIWAREAYSFVPMPRFVWVCELYRHGQYFTSNPKAFGEIVIDATSVSSKGHRSLIMMHYPNVIVVRHPQQTNSCFDECFELKDDGLIPAYGKNLDSIDGDPF